MTLPNAPSYSLSQKQRQKFHRWFRGIELCSIKGLNSVWLTAIYHSHFLVVSSFHFCSIITYLSLSILFINPYSKAQLLLLEKSDLAALIWTKLLQACKQRNSWLAFKIFQKQRISLYQGFRWRACLCDSWWVFLWIDP